MAKSLLAHLYSRIRGSQEDVATIALQYIVSQSKELNGAFTQLLATSIERPLDESLQYICQAVGENKERPDMAGLDKEGREIVLCEMKFYAGLTHNQPQSYIDRLRKDGGTGLIFVCPKAREQSLWTKLKERCSAQVVTTVNRRCICVDGVHMAILTWAEVVELLHKVASASAVELLADIRQLEGYCAQMDSDAFIPFSPEELTAENAKLAERYYEVVDRTIDLLCDDETVKTSKKGLKATAYRKGYTRSLFLDEFTITLNYDRDLWKNPGSIETPFWLSVREEWEETKKIKETLKKIPRLKKDDGLWNLTFLSLEPLSDATLDEVCEDLKRQVLEYVQLFR